MLLILILGCKSLKKYNKLTLFPMFSVSHLSHNFTTLDKRLRLLEVLVGRLSKHQSPSSSTTTTTTSTTPPPTILKWLDEEDDNDDVWPIDDSKPKPPRRPTTPPPPPPPPPPPSPAQTLALDLSKMPGLLVGLGIGLSVFIVLISFLTVCALRKLSCRRNSNQDNKTDIPMVDQVVPVGADEAAAAAVPVSEPTNETGKAPLEAGEDTSESSIAFIDQSPPKSAELVAELKTATYYRDRFGQVRPAGLGRGKSLSSFQPLTSQK